MRTLLTFAVVLSLSLFASCSDADNPVSGTGDIGFQPSGDDVISSDTGSTSSEDISGEDVSEAPTPDDCDACPATSTCVDGVCIDGAIEPCTPGETGPCSGTKDLMTCNDAGEAFFPVPCGLGEVCEAGACILKVCEPEASICVGVGAKKSCLADGSGYGAIENCPEGEYCADGKCASSCAVDPKFGATVGCTFWTVDLPNYPDLLFVNPMNEPHAVVISNPGEMDTEVTFTAQDGSYNDAAVVPAGASSVFLMPVMNVGDTTITAKGIKIESTRPVLVHQFNPWNNEASNDASLLIPEPFLGREYMVLSWPTTALELLPIGAATNQAGFLTVVATQNDTQVVVQVTAKTKAGDGISAMSPGNVQSFVLQQGEVLNIEAEPDSMFGIEDLTGSTISANKPVAAFSGHEEAVISAPVNGASSSCCADHLEEQLLPLETLASDYVLVKSKSRGGEMDLWRVQAVEANTTLSTVPPIAGLDGVTLTKKGEWAEAMTTESFELTGTGPLQVGQYLVSQSDTSAVTGDPSLILAIPEARFRDAYVLMVPSDYTENWITVTKEPTTLVNVNGQPVAQSEFFPVGGGAWEAAYVALEPGVHEVTGDTTFGLVAYGYNNAVSYGYPGGMTSPTE